MAFSSRPLLTRRNSLHSEDRNRTDIICKRTAYLYVPVAVILRLRRLHLQRHKCGANRQQICCGKASNFPTDLVFQKIYGGGCSQEVQLFFLPEKAALLSQNVVSFHRLRRELSFKTTPE